MDRQRVDVAHEVLHMLGADVLLDMLLDDSRGDALRWTLRVAKLPGLPAEDATVLGELHALAAAGHAKQLFGYNAAPLVRALERHRPRQRPPTSMAATVPS
eukprot:NODE_12791_length_443_cov_0.712025_g12768_i0.p1 GENE.NODE_12791_length_443_cov_0.712025_g12768_i0~~NODE_12791_length_443_cov_0.712025_g12768_i0.p1  ORF type:complete len:114 (-),score=27.18 NODE_12791_length_443_cov_0.712025_g12768_i0:102-404(-)